MHQFGVDYRPDRPDPNDPILAAPRARTAPTATSRTSPTSSRSRPRSARTPSASPTSPPTSPRSQQSALEQGPRGRLAGGHRLVTQIALRRAAVSVSRPAATHPRVAAGGRRGGRPESRHRLGAPRLHGVALPGVVTMYSTYFLGVGIGQALLGAALVPLAAAGRGDRRDRAERRRRRHVRHDAGRRHPRRPAQGRRREGDDRRPAHDRGRGRADRPAAGHARSHGLPGSPSTSLLLLGVLLWVGRLTETLP